MNNIAIIGHTQGIGKAISQEFFTQGWTVAGFSRSNGWDIGKCDIKALVEQISSNDVCVVNAHFAYKQVEICYALFDVWKDQKKTIVAISSNTNDTVKNKKWPYSVEKSALDTACLQLQNIKSSCKVMNIRPGYVDTQRVSTVIAPKMCANDVAKVIYFCVCFPTINISNITLVPKE